MSEYTLYIDSASNNTTERLSEDGKRRPLLFTLKWWRIILGMLAASQQSVITYSDHFGKMKPTKLSPTHQRPRLLVFYYLDGIDGASQPLPCKFAKLSMGQN